MSTGVAYKSSSDVFFLLLNVAVVLSFPYVIFNTCHLGFAKFKPVFGSYLDIFIKRNTLVPLVPCFDYVIHKVVLY